MEAPGPLLAIDNLEVSFRTEDGTVTLPGCLLLQFAPDGRCFDLREYWHLEPETSAPHDGWGSWRHR